MRLFGIGSGLFLLCFLWVITIIVLLLTARAKPPYTSLGPVILLISTSITTLLLLIPRSPFIEQEITSSEPIESKPITAEDVTDWMYFWRSLIIVFNLIAAAIGLVLIYSRWITKNMTRLRAPSVDFLQVRELIVIRGEGEPRGGGNDGGEGTSNGGKSKEKRKRKSDTKRTRKNLENKKETGGEEQEE